MTRVSVIIAFTAVCFFCSSGMTSCFTINSASLEPVGVESASVATTTEEEEEEFDTSDIYLRYQNYLSCEHPGIFRINQYHIRWIHNGTVLVDTNDTSIRLPRNMRLFDDYTLKINKFMRDKEYFEYICEITGPKDPEYEKEMELLFAQLDNETYVETEDAPTIRKRQVSPIDGDKIDLYPREYEKIYRKCWLIAARIAEQELESPLIIDEAFRDRMRNCMEENVNVYWSTDVVAVETVTTLREKRHIKPSEEWLPGVIETEHSVEKKSIIRCRPPSSARVFSVVQKANHFRWLRNGEIIWDFKNPLVKSSVHMEPVDRDTLEIDYDQEGDHNASYSCQFLNSLRKISTTTTTGSLSDKKLILRKIPADGRADVELLQELILQCMTKSFPRTLVQWYLKEKMLDVKSDRLRLNVTSKDFAGEYKCVVSNICFENEEFTTFTVNVLYKPEITVEKNSVHTDLGDKTELSCNVFAYPPAKVEWLHNDKLLNSSSSRMYQRIFKEKHTLVIRDVQIMDYARYTCQATNFLGRVTRVILLTGIANKAKFKAEKERRSHTAYTLIWEADSSPPIIQYRLLFRKYKKNNTDKWIQLIIPSTDNSGPIHTELYTLTGLEPSTVYEATVSSRNYFGWSEPSSVHRFATENLDMVQFLDVVEDVMEITTELYSEEISTTMSTFSDFSYVTNEIESALEQKGASEKLSIVYYSLLLTVLVVVVN